MPYAPPPTVVEDPDDLRDRLRAERDPERKRRLHALVLFASGEATTRGHVADHLAVNRKTVTRRLDAYRTGGLDALLTRNEPGPAPGQRALPEAAFAALKRRLAEPEGFGGYHEVQAWLREGHGLEVPYKTVYTLVRYRPGAKLKAPRPEHPRKA